MAELTFDRLAEMNSKRAARWHGDEGIDSWTVNDWAVALGGEVGEALNACKKHRRFLDGLQQHGNVPTKLSEAEDAIMEELADTVIYASLLALRLRRSLGDAVAAKFNATSIREGFPERL